MALKLYAAPSTEPVSLAEAKAQCRVDSTDDDAFITGLIAAAREMAEKVARRAFVTQTWDLVLDAWPDSDQIELPRPPLQSVMSVTYVDDDGVSATFPSSSYLVDTDSEPGRVVLKTGYTWPSATLQAANGVRVRFVAGYGAAAAVPAHLAAAIKLLVGHWYENREATAAGDVAREVPLGVQALLTLDRNLGF